MSKTVFEYWSISQPPDRESLTGSGNIFRKWVDVASSAF